MLRMHTTLAALLVYAELVTHIDGAGRPLKINQNSLLSPLPPQTIVSAFQQGVQQEKVR